MPLLKALMDGMTTAVPTEDHARIMQSRLDELIRCCRMSFKSKKSRSLAIVWAVAVSFSVVEQTIPTVFLGKLCGV